MRQQFKTPFEYDKWLSTIVEKSDIVEIWVGFSEDFNSAAQKTWSATFWDKGSARNFSINLYDDRSRALAPAVDEHTPTNFRYVPSDRTPELCAVALRCLRAKAKKNGRDEYAIGKEPITFVVWCNDYSDVEQIVPTFTQV